MLGGWASAEELPLHSLGCVSESVTRVLQLLWEAFFSPQVQSGSGKSSGISQRQCEALRRISFSGCSGGFLCWCGREYLALWLVFGTDRVFAKHDVC